GIAHQFINDSDEMLEILDVGIPDPNDVIEYPDDGVTYKKAEGRAYKNGAVVADWSSDPNL
ncbi:MAG: mannose-6-phosphate isomerase, partial [Candidatus Melainabacteria bacterium]|nr:mannose-6-phosphate isomerase [Candidatus Melainabacteria bacterium]